MDLLFLQKQVHRTPKVPKYYIPKEKSEWSAEDKASVLKDVSNLLHNNLDNVMTNRVIGSKTTNEIWDALEVRYQGKKVIKNNRKQEKKAIKNRKILLIQESTLTQKLMSH